MRRNVHYSDEGWGGGGTRRARQGWYSPGTAVPHPVVLNAKMECVEAFVPVWDPSQLVREPLLDSIIRLNSKQVK